LEKQSAKRTKIHRSKTNQDEYWTQKEEPAQRGPTNLRRARLLWGGVDKEEKNNVGRGLKKKKKSRQIMLNLEGRGGPWGKKKERREPFLEKKNNRGKIAIEKGVRNRTKKKKRRRPALEREENLEPSWRLTLREKEK